jgi:metal-dependent amidase/aminoacylase/carboxypeptidase family protein
MKTSIEPGDRRRSRKGNLTRRASRATDLERVTESVEPLARGLSIFVGATRREIDPATAPANHSPRFHVDERALLLGVRSLANAPTTGAPC